MAGNVLLSVLAARAGERHWLHHGGDCYVTHRRWQDDKVNACLIEAGLTDLDM
ncbi:hypothetical protein [Allostella humosa]|nr:hypothetical protein [Stella humosa]